MQGIKEFMDQFDFKRKGHLQIGVERECFLSRNGKILPIAPEIVAAINHPSVGYELSACQLEYRVGPTSSSDACSDIMDQIRKMEEILRAAEKKLGFKRVFVDVGPDDMSLDVYPDPDGRYQQIVEKMPKDVLQAACQVAGTHIHIGVDNIRNVMTVYNKVIRYWERFAALGDNSHGKRLSLYQKVAPNCIPVAYESWNAFYQSAIKRGFVDNPRNCWDLIRVSKHGTIEFRMFGSTDDLDLLKIWIYACYGICHDATDWFYDDNGRCWSTRWHG